MNTARPSTEAVVKRLRAVAAERNRIHVIPSNGRWAVMREDLSRASRVLGEKSKAIEMARALAREGSMAVVIHGRDGSVQALESHLQ